VSRVLVIASIAWPLLLGGAVLARAHQHSSGWVPLVYAACSRICHQRPLRSFHTSGVQWPVCARCSGLYVAAGAGALTAFYRRRPAALSARLLVALAAVPTALTLGLEWIAPASMTNVLRFAAALPLGAAVAFVLVNTTRVDKKIN
jgi:uncharacterized membrane protein